MFIDIQGVKVNIEKVKYIKAAQKDIPLPNQDNETYTIRVVFDESCGKTPLEIGNYSTSGYATKVLDKSFCVVPNKDI